MNVKQLEKQAKELVAAARAGDAGAVARFGDLPLKLAERAARARARARLLELARARPDRGRAAVPRRHRVLRGPGGRDRDREGDQRRRRPPRARRAPRLLELGRAEAARCGARERGGAGCRRSCSPTARSSPATASGWSSCSTRIPSSSRCGARTATTSSGWRTTSGSPGCCSSAGRTSTAATTTAGRSSTRRGTATTRALARLLLDGGRADRPVRARATAARR